MPWTKVRSRAKMLNEMVAKKEKEKNSHGERKGLSAAEKGGEGGREREGPSMALTKPRLGALERDQINTKPIEMGR